MEIKELLIAAISKAAAEAVEAGVFPDAQLPGIVLEVPPKKELGDFLKRLNESDLDLSQFDYLHNNPYAYGALSARKVIDEKGVYLYLND